MKSTILFFSLTLFPLFLSADETFNDDGQFYVQLPPSWVIVPKPILDEHVRQVQQRMPKMPLTEFSFAYQPAPKDDVWFTYPFCIGFVFRGGRPNEANFIQFANRDFRSVFPKATALVEQRTQGIIDHSDFGVPVYDIQKHILWTPLKISLPSGISAERRITGIVAQLLTSDGYVKLRFYASASEYETLLPQFKRMVESIRFQSNLQFTPHQATATPTTRTDGWEFFGKVIAFAVVGALVAAAKVSRKLKKTPSSGSTLD